MRLTDYLRNQGAVGMVTNLQSGMTLFLKPSGHCRAQMYSLSSQFLKTWCLLSARRIAAESEAARIAAQIEATRIAAEVEAARIAAKLRPIGLPWMLRPLGSPLRLPGSPDAMLLSPRSLRLQDFPLRSPLPLTVLLSSPQNANRRREKGTSLWCVCSLNMTSGTLRGRRPISLRLLKTYPQEPPSY